MRSEKTRENAVFEKKHWISITGLCNNNCRFCLDSHRKDRFHRKKEDIFDELKKAREKGNTKIIISGGDPTIHPDFIEIIKKSSELGFSKIQAITNGRMFADLQFLKKAVDVGLSEITFSIHSHKVELGDSLSRVSGSFKQALKAIENTKKFPKLIVNTDTVITRQNYKYLKNIFWLLHKKGIREMNLMNLCLTGNAYDSRSELAYSMEEAAPYVKEIIELAEKNNVVLWLSRFPPEYLEGYEKYAEDPYKMVEDVKGMWETVFANHAEPPCRGIRCSNCGIRLICPSIVKAKKSSEKENGNKEKIKITKEALNKDLAGKKEFVIEFPSPEARLSEYESSAVKLPDAKVFLENLPKDSEIYFRGIPFCIIPKEKIAENSILPLESPCLESNDLQGYISLAKELSKNARIKPKKCFSCIFYEKCPGVYLQYFRLFGSKELKPALSKEIRINLECNQKCVFCNTDENAENVILEAEKIIEKLEEWKKQNVLNLIISGKEPTLHPDLVKIISKAKELGYMNVEMQTNAMLLKNKELAKSLAKAGLDSAFVSLHAHSDELSSKMTLVEGSFNDTVEGIMNLISEGVKITFNVVVNSLNYKNLKEIVLFIRSSFSKINQIVFSFVAPVCSAWGNKEVIPKFADVKPFLEEAIELCKSKNIKFRIPARCGVPFCFLGENLVYSDEFNELFRHDEKDKSKPDECEKCLLNGKCSGLWGNYIKLYGTDEIKPVDELPK